MLFRLAKSLKGDPESLMEICQKQGMVTSWKSTREIVASCRRSGCLEIPSETAAPATSKGQADKRKYTELIQYFSENYDE